MDEYWYNTIKVPNRIRLLTSDFNPIQEKANFAIEASQQTQLSPPHIEYWRQSCNKKFDEPLISRSSLARLKRRRKRIVAQFVGAEWLFETKVSVESLGGCRKFKA